MNRPLIFLLCMFFGISIAFPILYIYQPVYITCDIKEREKREKREKLLIGFYTVFFSLIFTMMFMSIIISIQLKCF